MSGSIKNRSRSRRVPWRWTSSVLRGVTPQLMDAMPSTRVEVLARAW